MSRCRVITVVLLMLAPAAAHADAVRVFLNRHGGTLTAGQDDPVAGTSWIAGEGPGGQIDVPAYRGGDRRWAEVMACVRDRYAAFAVDFVDERPARGAYTMIMVGGTPAIANLGHQISGIATSDAGVLRHAVGFAFSASLGEQATPTCETIVHEVGHTLGLDHAIGCEDPMSYETCGPKRFVDADLVCGEYDARACANGEATQNSVQYLTDAVGLRVEPEAPDDEEDAPEIEEVVAAVVDAVVEAVAEDAPVVEDAPEAWSRGEHCQDRYQPRQHRGRHHRARHWRRAWR